MRMLGPALAGGALALSLVAGMADAQPARPQARPQAKSDVPSVQRGVVIARTYCARCHSIDKVSQSPLAVAPPFRDLHKSYPVERLEEPLAEGLVTGHPSMPEFRFDPDQIGDFIAFLKSLE
jgi:mono/diheme cytochrome c family protein